MAEPPPHLEAAPAAISEVPCADRPAVTLTPEAVARVLDAMHQEQITPHSHGLRVGVITGGCCGLQYLLDFTARPTAEDLTYDHGGLRIYVDPFSAAHLAGTVIDCVQDASGTGFRINNPNIRPSCDCGASYRR